MIVDTNVLIALTDDGDTADIAEKMAFAPACVINEVIFAEFAGRYLGTDAAVRQVNALGLSIQRLSLDDCHRAGVAFREYRRRDGKRTTILPDFLIGAQAEQRGWPILTSDRKGFASYFPDVE